MFDWLWNRAVINLPNKQLGIRIAPIVNRRPTNQYFIGLGIFVMAQFLSHGASHVTMALLSHGLTGWCKGPWVPPWRPDASHLIPNIQPHLTSVSWVSQPIDSYIYIYSYIAYLQCGAPQWCERWFRFTPWKHPLTILISIINHSDIGVMWTPTERYRFHDSPTL